MFVKFYTFQPLDDSIRTTFELPAWPYTNNPEHYKLFEDYLKENSIFLYEDSIDKDGELDVNYAISLPLDIDPEKSFTAFRFEGVLDGDTLAIKDFPAAQLRNPKFSIARVNEHYGDTKAWFAWNIPGTVSYWNATTGGIKFEEMSELIQENAKPRCTQK